MIRKCSDFATQRLGGSQITGIRAKDGRVVENFFSGSKRFGIASGDDDLSRPRRLSVGRGQADPGSAASDEKGFGILLFL